MLRVRFPSKINDTVHNRTPAKEKTRTTKNMIAVGGYPSSQLLSYKFYQSNC